MANKKTRSRKRPSDQNDADGAKPGTERARDEQRDGGGPRYAGGSWDLADQREPDERFGHARTDDAELAEVRRDRDLEREPEVDDADADAGVETDGEHEGMGRGSISRNDADRGGQRETPGSRSSK